MTDLTALALNAAHQLPVAELHGVVCGIAVCRGGEVPLQDLVQLLGADALTDQASVDGFVEAAVEDLQAPQMTFAPLLPEDDAPLAVRTEALGQWCGSFLAGLAAGLARRGTGSLEDTPEEVREIVADFAAIAQIDPESAELSADALEGDLVELEEFVKVGVLLVMSAFEHESDDSPE